MGRVDWGGSCSCGKCKGHNVGLNSIRLYFSTREAKVLEHGIESDIQLSRGPWKPPSLRSLLSTGRRLVERATYMCDVTVDGKELVSRLQSSISCPCFYLLRMLKRYHQVLRVGRSPGYQQSKPGLRVLEPYNAKRREVAAIVIGTRTNRLVAHPC
jgi:hypothetical protein